MSDNDSALPDGMQCSDCAYIARCQWLLSRDGSETVCDWAPSVFRQSAKSRERGARTIGQLEPPVITWGS